jgi:predicted Fe-Mo cluster-binding NifX family protein
VKIAVCSQNRKTVTGHAGKCRRFRLFEHDGQALREQDLLELPIEGTFHATPFEAPHPLDDVQALIALDMGDGLKRKLAARGIIAHLTELTDPHAAIQSFLTQHGATPHV